MIEPFYSFFVFVTSSSNYPNNNFCIFSRSISYDFTQVIMIGFFELIFNNDLSSCTFFCGI